MREGGRPTRERVTPLRVWDDATLVEVRLETGFLHQIRATLAHLGHPIVGDADYGGPAGPRPMLHAASLSFEEIDVHVAPPADLAEAIAARSVGDD